MRIGAAGHSYGDEITSTTNDREKFGTYTRDSYTGLDYADQRWFTSTYGRFNTADPYQASAGLSDPGSWNRYSYVQGDPANGNDPAGLALQAPGECDDSNLWDGCSNRSNSLAYYYCGTASSAVLALSPELSPICSQIMQAAFPVAVPAAPAESDAPSCFVEQEYRPVDAGSAFLSRVNHAYFFVGDSAGDDFVLEGLPQYNPPKGGGNAFGDLFAYTFNVSANGTVAGDPKDHPLTDSAAGSVAGSQASVCNVANKLISATAHFGGQYYDPTGVFGANSNSFAAYLARMTGQNLGTPPNAPGYNWANIH